MARQQVNYYRPSPKAVQHPDTRIFERFSSKKPPKITLKDVDRSAGKGTYPLHIVILEDHPFQRKAAVCVAETIGVTRITEAEDGADAIAKISDSSVPVDIVI